MYSLPPSFRNSFDFAAIPSSAGRSLPPIAYTSARKSCVIFIE